MRGGSLGSSIVKKVERELTRGAAPLAVLKLLSEREQYGYELVQALETRTRGVLAIGQSSLYPMLYNLEAQGLVSSREVEAPGRRTRKYYRLTDRGARRLAKGADQWRALAGAMVALGIDKHS